MGTTSSNSTTMDRLRDVLNEYTGLEAKFVGMITYDDPRLMELPIIISHGSPNESEKENLAEYIMAGGFIFGGLNTEALEKYGGLTQVKDFWSERLSDTHPVYGAFFDLKGGMPFGYVPSKARASRASNPEISCAAILSKGDWRLAHRATAVGVGSTTTRAGIRRGSCGWRSISSSTH
jgi:hypothetical protein